jgi:hypothetical protein
MSISHADFFRVVPAGLGRMRFTRTGLRIEASEGTRVIVIELSDERPRRLGALILPSVSVTVESTGFDDADWLGFLSRFDQAFQRGGG